MVRLASNDNLGRKRKKFTSNCPSTFKQIFLPQIPVTLRFFFNDNTFNLGILRSGIRDSYENTKTNVVNLPGFCTDTCHCEVTQLVNPKLIMLKFFRHLG